MQLRYSSAIAHKCPLISTLGWTFRSATLMTSLAVTGGPYSSQ